MMEVPDLLQEELIVVNIGLEEFFTPLVEFQIQAVHVDWRPAAQGDPDMLDILDNLL
jgi:hypothetical protein